MSEQSEEFEIEDVLDAARRVLGTVKNADGYDELASAIAHRYAQRSDFNRAVEIADTINDPFTMEERIAGIAVMLAAEGRDADAFELLESLEDLSHQATAKSKIAVAYAANGDFDRAIEIASGMDDNSATMVDIAYQWIEQGQCERALEIIETLDFPLGTVWVRMRIAQEYAKADRAEEAIEMISQALDEAEEIEPPNEFVGTLSELAFRFFQMGKGVEAREILSQALEVARDAEEIYRDAALAHTAVGHTRLRLFEEAVSITETIDSLYQATSTLIELALIEHEDESRHADALQLLSDAYELIVEVVPETQRDETQKHHLLSRIAYANAGFGETERALKAAQSVGETDEKDHVISNVAVRFAEAAKYDEARTAVRAMSRESFKANALVRVCRVASADGELGVGAEWLAEATSIVERLRDPFDRVKTLMEVADAFAEREERDRLPSLFTQALGDIKLITSEFRKVAALLSISDACAQTECELDEESKETLWDITAV